MKKILFLLILISFPSLVLAWNGYDHETGTEVEIEERNLVRTGNYIEVYDYDEGVYKDVEVEDIRSTGYGMTEIDIYDYNSDEYKTLEMYR